jgi:pyruvate/2-oxoglutarate dehydrogenase complex dihydrolipoamide dehydrogenase (E3) component
VAGSDKPGNHYLKSLTAAEELLDLVEAGQARTALILGAGFIGVEIGLLLADLGPEVTQPVRSRVMRSMLDPETSELVLGIMQERWRRCSRVSGRAPGRRRADALR